MGVRQAVNPHPDRDGFNRGLTYGKTVVSHQVLPHLVVCPASSTPDSKQDLRSPGENHSRCLSLHILRYRVIIRALRDRTTPVLAMPSTSAHTSIAPWTPSYGPKNSLTRAFFRFVRWPQLRSSLQEQSDLQRSVSGERRRAGVLPRYRGKIRSFSSQKDRIRRSNRTRCIAIISTVKGEHYERHIEG